MVATFHRPGEPPQIGDVLLLPFGEHGPMPPGWTEFLGQDGKRFGWRYMDGSEPSGIVEQAHWIRPCGVITDGTGVRPYGG